MKRSEIPRGVYPEPKNRFLAESTLIPFALLRAVRKRKGERARNGADGPSEGRAGLE